MNDPNKVINVNLSSLLSLKAELLRKQAEVNKAKVAKQSDITVNDNEYTAKTSRTSKRENKVVEPIAIDKKGDGTIVYEHDDSALLEKSKRILEAKSKHYERMARAGGGLNSDDNCLVLFNRKQQDEKSATDSQFSPSKSRNNENSNSSSSDSEEDGLYEDSDDWVEYTDCLGRTRKCLKEDLENVKKRDAELAASMPERLDQNKPFWLIDTKGAKKQRENNDDDDDNETMIGPPPPTESIFSDGCSLMSKHDEQRVNWEKKEQENFDKPDVHYQDVFFDEARQHGVGYYAFSTDEEERKRQQQELEDARLKTVAEQKRRDSLRAQRERIIAERVLAAKNRQRARLGLPPLEPEELEKEQEQKSMSLAEVKLNETKEERKARKRAEKLKRKQEAEEASREKERQEHVRPWDMEKEGIQQKLGADKLKSNTDDSIPGETEWTYKPERVPLSQEEWNERKRAERKQEFAPVPEPIPILKRTNFSNDGQNETDAMPPPPPVPPPSMAYNPINFVSYQTTRKEKKFQRKNYESENYDEGKDHTDRSGGTAIPPPENLDADYALPSRAKRPKTNNELERSIEAGLRFLRNNSDKGTLSTKSSWTAKADY